MFPWKVIQDRIVYNALVTNVTLFQCAHGRSYKTGLTVQCISNKCDPISMFPWKVLQDRIDYNALVTNVTLFQCSHGRSYKTRLTTMH